MNRSTIRTVRHPARRAVLTAIAAFTVTGAAFTTVGWMAHEAQPDMSYQGSTASSPIMAAGADLTVPAPGR